MSHLRKIIMAARSLDNVLSINGRIPWHVPADWSFLLRCTTGHSALIGRRSFENDRAWTLPLSKLFVLAGRGYQPPAEARAEMDIEVHHDLVSALRSADRQAAAKMLASCDDDSIHHVQHPDPFFILGGARVYESTLPIADEMLLTEIHAWADPQTPRAMKCPNAPRLTHAAEGRNITYFPLDKIDPETWTLVSACGHPADPANPYSCLFTHFRRNTAQQSESGLIGDEKAFAAC